MSRLRAAHQRLRRGLSAHVARRVSASRASFRSSLSASNFSSTPAESSDSDASLAAKRPATTDKTDKRKKVFEAAVLSTASPEQLRVPQSEAGGEVAPRPNRRARRAFLNKKYHEGTRATKHNVKNNHAAADSGRVKPKASPQSHESPSTHSGGTKNKKNSNNATGHKPASSSAPPPSGDRKPRAIPSALQFRPTTMTASSANVFAYRNTWTSFFDLVLHAEKDPTGVENWRPKAVSDEAKRFRWSQLPTEERERLLNMRRRGMETEINFAYAKAKLAQRTAAMQDSEPKPVQEDPKDVNLEEDDIDDSPLPQLVPHADMAPALTPQLRCQQIVHNHCLSSDDIRAMIGLLNDDLLPGMKANSSMYTELVTRLCIEGDAEAARQLLLELPTNGSGLHVSGRAQALVDSPTDGRQLIVKRTQLLRYLSSFGADGLRSADRLFDGLLEVGTHTMDPIFFAVYLQNCFSATAQKAQIDRLINEYNLEPSPIFYAEYLGRLMLEGSDEMVQEFLDHELGNLGLAEHRKRLEASLAAGPSRSKSKARSLSRLRVSLLKKWSFMGVPGREAIRQLVGALVSRRKADGLVFNSVLRLCYDLESQEQVLQNMEALGIRPDLISYTTLLTRMRVEGNENAARELFENRLPQLGIKADEHFLDVLNLGQPSLSRMRRSQINVFSLAGDDGRAAAWKLHSKLLKAGLLDASVARTMFSLTRTPAEARLIQTSMAQSGGITLEDQLENEAWSRRNRPMREHFISDGDSTHEEKVSSVDIASGASRAPTAAQHFARLIRDPLSRIETG